jgi:hypothetical protein
VFGKREFTEFIQVTDLEMGGFPGLPGGPTLITESLKEENLSQLVREGRDNQKGQREASFQDGGQDQEFRDAGKFVKMERAADTLPRPQKEHSPTDSLI